MDLNVISGRRATDNMTYQIRIVPSITDAVVGIPYKILGIGFVQFGIVG